MSLSNGEIIAIAGGNYAYNANITRGATLSFDMEISDEGYNRIEGATFTTNVNGVLSLPPCNVRVNIDDTEGTVLANLEAIPS